MAIHTPGREEASGDQPCLHLDPGHPASRIQRNKCLLFELPLFVAFVMQTELTKTDGNEPSQEEGDTEILEYKTKSGME